MQKLCIYYTHYTTFVGHTNTVPVVSLGRTELSLTQTKEHKIAEEHMKEKRNYQTGPEGLNLKVSD